MSARVLVTDSNSRSALATTRSLGRSGDFVVTCGDQAPALAGSSRFSQVHALYPNPERDPSGFAACIRELIARHRIEVLLPMTEITMLTLANDPALWATGVKWPFADAVTVTRAADKAHIMRLAREVGVPTPAMAEAASPADLERVATGLTYPVVVKPARSRVRTGEGWLGTSVSYAFDTEDLERRLQALPREAFPVLLQERIEGPGIGVFLCFQHGRRVAVFAHQRIREKPPSGGVSVLSESREPDPVAVDLADKLLARLGWRGVAMVEFKQDNRDGSLRLMEINGRFWGSLQLPVDAGVDFPRLAVDVALDRPVTPVVAYRVGLRSRWLWGDLMATLRLLTRRTRRLDLPSDHPGRWRTLLEFFRSFDSRTRNDTLHRDDWRPFVVESCAWISRALGGRRKPNDSIHGHTE